jgi:hypothetical protein
MKLRGSDVIADDGAVIASFDTNAEAWGFVDRRNRENRSPKEHTPESAGSPFRSGLKPLKGSG